MHASSPVGERSQCWGVRCDSWYPWLRKIIELPHGIDVCEGRGLRSQGCFFLGFAWEKDLSLRMPESFRRDFRLLKIDMSIW
jgi:hypothetical protein